MDATMQSRWMTLQEVAEYLQLSKDMNLSSCSERQDSSLEGRKPMAIQKGADRPLDG